MHRYTRMVMAVLLGVGLLAGTQAVAAEAVLNGDFASNAALYTTAPGYNGGSNPAAIDNWTGPSGINGVGISTPFGPADQSAATYYAFIQGYPKSLSQTITLSANTTHNISFLAANRNGNSSAQGRVVVADNSTTYYDSGVTVWGTAAFQLVTNSFTTPASIDGTITITLSNDSTSGDSTVCYSDVSIEDVPPAGFSATGGSTTDLGGYRIHTFTGSGTFSVTGSTNVEVLVVGGGGGGGGSTGGGGGAGGYIYTNSYAVSSGDYTVTVGAGGAGGTMDVGANGSNSVFGTLTAIGGGAGGANAGTDEGQNGGSGGGGSYVGGFGIAGLGTAGQGNDGGVATFWANPYPTGGGGGAGAVGADGSAGTLGHGGDGLSSDISGATTWYAGGGGGGNYGGDGGSGGQGGGGQGAGSVLATAGNGVANTGGGGGGMGQNRGTQAGYGGSGIVIVRYSLGGGAPAGPTTGYSMPITFTNYSGRATLDNFPVLVKLTTANTANYAGFLDTTDGYDLRFWSNSELTGTELAYEVESFDSSGTSYIWVKVPSFSHNGTIWASWGDPDFNSQQGYTTDGSVWSEGFAGVWHLDEVSGVEDLTDATANGNDADLDADTDNVVGLIAKGQEFDGGDDYIRIPDSPSVSVTGSITLEAWGKLPSFSGGSQNIIAKDSNAAYRYRIQGTGTELWSLVSDGSYELDKVSYTFSPNTWYHIVCVMDMAADEVRYYINGQLAGTPQALAKNSIQDTGGALLLGNYAAAHTGEDFIGIMDEARITDGVRSADWLWACYMNQGESHDSFVEYGAVSEVGGGVVWSDTDTTNIVQTSAWASATVNTNLTDTVLVWHTSDQGTDSTNDWPVANRLSLGAQSAGIVTGQMTGLVASTSYVWRFYGDDGNTNGWSASVPFSTPGPPAVDLAGGVTNVDVGTATLQGRVVATNSTPLTHVRIYFGDNDGGETHSWDTNYVFSVGAITEGVAFSTNLTGLLYGVEYSYRVYASNTYGEVWSAATNFTTLPIAAGPSTGISYHPVTGDGDSEITNTTTYTHCVDFGSDSPRAEINGVQFQSGGTTFGSKAGTSATVGTGTTTIPSAHGGNGSADPYLNGGSFCDMEDLVEDMNYNDSTGIITIDGLTPGQNYRFRLYNRQWGTGAGSNRGQNFGFDTDGVGSDMSGAEDTGSFEADDASSPDPSFGTFSQVYALSYVYQLEPGVSTLTVYINMKSGDTGSYHMYGLTNEEMPPSGVGLGISNAVAASIRATTADLGGTLNATGSVFTVYAYWSTTSNANAAAWAADGTKGSALVGTYTNVVGQSVSTPVSGLTRGETYYYTMMATNATTNIWASPNAVFTTDGTAPEPDQMTWGIAPAAMDTSRVIMTATTAADALNDPCQYFFENTNTSENSGWTLNTVWTNTGLTEGTTYGYQVKARDAVSNETAWSVIGTATPAGDLSPPSPSPMTWDVAPAAILDNTIVMTATTATDPNGPVEYYFENTTNSNNSGWITSTTWTNTGLTMGATYGYRVWARDSLGNTGQWSPVSNAVSVAPAITIFYDSFEDPVVGSETSQTDPTGWADVSPSGNRAGLGNGISASSYLNYDGNQAAWLNVYNTEPQLQTTASILNTNLQSGFKYTLSFDAAASTTSYATYADLLAGTNVVMTAQVGSLTKNFASHQASEEFSPTPSDPDLGESLAIRLRVTGGSWNAQSYVDNLRLTKTDTSGDSTPPTPDPLTWTQAPTAAADGSIIMVATVATDAVPVEYFFTNTVNGNVSGWQTSYIWTDTGLTDGVTYSYKAKARDTSANLNETGWTSEESATADDTVILYETFELPQVTWYGATTSPGWYTSGGSLMNEGGGLISTPFGEQIARCGYNGGPTGRRLETTSISDVLTVGTAYSLTFNAGNIRPDGGTSHSGVQYTAELIAGSTVVANKIATTSTHDASETGSATFTPASDNPNLGGTLKVRFYMSSGDYHWQPMFDNVKLVGVPDETAPSPDPMGFVVAPFGITSTSIGMTASNATDATAPVEYLFTNATSGASSGWSTNTFWRNNGLTGGNTYGYKVKARDAAGNETAWSAVSTAGATNETAAPQPDPMTFSVEPVAVDSTTIAMTATVASDEWNNPVEYFFNNTSNANDSGWISSNSWSDTGLSAGITYGYQVKARDAVGNETAYSSELTASPEADSTPPNPDPMGFEVLPDAIDPYTITMTASNATDFSEPVEYYFLNTNNSANSGWISSRVWTNSSLTPGVTYGFQVKARDAVSNETAYSDVATEAAVAPAITIFYDSFENPPHADAYGFVIDTGDSEGWVASGTAGLLDEESGYFTTDDGTQAAAVDDSGTFTTSTNLTATLQPTLRYDLSFNLASKNGGSVFYRVELWAGGAQLNYKQGTIASANMAATTQTISFTAAPNDPNLGDQLEIRLRHPNAGGNGDEPQIYFDNVRLTTTHTGGDSTPPTPGTATWYTEPFADMNNQITMQANVATDTHWVQYFFTNTVNGNTSGWLEDPWWTDTGLTPGVEYTYMAKARDNTVNFNETAWSSTASVTCDAAVIFFEGFEAPSINRESTTSLTDPTGWNDISPVGNRAGLGSALAAAGYSNFDRAQAAWLNVYNTTPVLQTTTTVFNATLESGNKYELSFDAAASSSSYTLHADLLAGTNAVMTAQVGSLTKNFASHQAYADVSPTAAHPDLGEELAIRIRVTGGDWNAQSYVDNLRLTKTGTAGDTTPPTPDPLTWSQVPTPAADGSIMMVADVATDDVPVEYFFTNTVNGNVSGWQSSRIWTDTSLADGVTYSYMAKARDTSANLNETGWSSAESAVADEDIILYETFENTDVTGRTSTMESGWQGSDTRTGLWDEDSGTMTTPWGEQAMYVWNSRYVQTTAGLLSDVLTAGTDYTLTFNAASENGNGGIDYDVELMAGTTVLGSANGGPMSTNNMADYSDTITFQADSSHADLGERLVVRLRYVSGDWHYVNGYDNVKLRAVPDETAPSPDPLGFSVAPFGINATSVVMTAGTATDATGPVEYLFTNDTAGVSSGWSTNRFWRNDGLTGGQSYNYRVKARDFVANETAWSAVSTAGSTNELVAPTPDPMTFAVAPASLDTTTIGMTATVASDEWNNPCEYYFVNTSNSNNSGWITTNYWQDTGLTPAVTNGYRVKARDAVGNETAYSTEAFAAPEADTTPPSPDPMAFEVPPAATDPFTMVMTATNATDFSNPVEYYFVNVSNSANSGWSTSRVWTNDSLTAGNTYGYRVKARDAFSNETAYSAVALAVAEAPAVEIFSDDFENPPHADVTGAPITTGDSQGWVASGTAGLLDEDSTFYSTHDGSQAAAMDDSGSYTTSSNLTNTLQTGVQYDLTFTVASKDGASVVYEVDLLAGSTVLDRARGTVASTDMSATTGTISFTASPSDSSLGDTLAIRLKHPNAGGGTDEPHVYYDTVRLTTTDTRGDSTPPAVPTWLVEPLATDNNGLTMSASDVSDARGVQYYFVNTDNGNNSGWQDESWWREDGLTANATYNYRVKVRDNSANLNESAWSSVAGGTVDPYVILYETFESPVVYRSGVLTTPGWLSNDGSLRNEDGAQMTTPYGAQVAAAGYDGGPSGRRIETTTALTDVLRTRCRYTLTFNAGNVNTSTGDPRSDNEYTVELIAGSTVLTNVVALTSTNDMSETNVLEYVTLGEHANEGETLKIRIYMSAGDNSAQPLFDNVRLRDERLQAPASLFLFK